MAFGFFNKIKEGLEKTRKSFVKNVETVIIGYAEIDDDFLDDLEAVMLTSDLGPKTTEYLMKEIRRGVTEGIINNTGDVMPFMDANSAIFSSESSVLSESIVLNI